MLHNKIHKMCVIDTETTGLIPGYNEITQLTILPVTNDFTVDKEILPFNTWICPEFPERTYKGANRKNLNKALKQGHPSNVAKDLLEHWLDRNDFETILIMPIASNWPFDAGMIAEWLGTDMFHNTFHGHYRDLMMCCTFINDQLSRTNTNPMFSRLKLSSIATELEVPYETQYLHDSFYDCDLTLRCYREMLCRGWVL